MIYLVVVMKEVLDLVKKEVLELVKKEVLELVKKEVLELAKKEVLELVKKGFLEIVKKEFLEIVKEEVLEIVKKEVLEMQKGTSTTISTLRFSRGVPKHRVSRIQARAGLLLTEQYHLVRAVEITLWIHYQMIAMNSTGRVAWIQTV
jgi:DNA repair exonuclease SbcCD nuclease subunit